MLGKCHDHGWMILGDLMLKFILIYGAMGFGTLCALLMLLWQIYKNEIPTFNMAVFQTLLWIFFAGPLWGLTMWPRMKKISGMNKQPQESK